MAVTDADIAFVTDLFADIPAITTRKMFGGLSLYSDGSIFAIIGPDQRIYLKAYDDLADALCAEGAEQFSFPKKDGRVGSMAYWTLPDAAQDDPEQAADWARKSLVQNG
ncbi:MAG: TfoX/Sxy family protein [Pseudomonadota bacterium]